MKRKPQIAIFCKGNIPTKDEQDLINKLAMYNLVIINSQNYDPRETLDIDCCLGLVPKQYKNLPTLDDVVKAYTDSLFGVGNSVGGLPPNDYKQPKSDNNADQDDETDTAKNKEHTNDGLKNSTTPPPKTGFDN